MGSGSFGRRAIAGAPDGGNLGTFVAGNNIPCARQ
jgi:hypothetical protein